MKKTILAVGAHPDDLDFSSAGTIAKFAREGGEVFYLIISDGSRGGHKVKFAGRKLAGIRKKEQLAAARVLGVKNVFFLNLQDGEIENTRLLRKKIVKAVRKTRPDIVFCFDPANLAFDGPKLFHRDHRQAAEAVFDAVYPAAGSPFFFPELLRQGYEPHQPKEIWFFGSARPGKFVDISPTMEKKITALFCHESQLPDKEGIRKRIVDRARKTGKVKGLKYAEAFRTLKLE